MYHITVPNWVITLQLLVKQLCCCLCYKLLSYCYYLHDTASFNSDTEVTEYLGSELKILTCFPTI